MINTAILRAAVLAVMCSLAACGGNAKTIEQINSQTQQILDLEEAYNKGIVTDEVYESTKARILAQG
ncbi:MAG: hypothetical protein ACI9DH_001762 [Halioglobus sp.]|jgi:hypothetical protein